MGTGLYGIFGDDLYKITEPRLTANRIISLDSEKTKTSVKYWNDEKLEVNINLSNLTDDSPTNGEVASAIKEAIVSSGLTSIDTLADVYRMCIEFEIIDSRDGSMKDGGTFMQEFEMAPALVTVGVDSDDEITAREVLTTGTVKFVRTYRKVSPIGVSQRGRGLIPFQLVIKGVHILQAKKEDVQKYASAADDINVVKPSIRDMIHPDYYNPNPVPRHPSGSFIHQRPEHRERVEYPVYDEFIKIYDTEDEGIEFDPISLTTDVNQLTVHVAVSLNNYAVIYDSDTIQELLDANDTTTTTPSTGDPLEDDKSGLSDANTDPGDNGVNPPAENPETTENSTDDSKKEETTPETEVGEDTEKENQSTDETPEQKTDTESTETVDNGDDGNEGAGENNTDTTPVDGGDNTVETTEKTEENTDPSETNTGDDQQDTTEPTTEEGDDSEPKTDVDPEKNTEETEQSQSEDGDE